MVATHISFGLDLIALSLGTALFMWSVKSPGKGSWVGKLFGLIVMILSIISIICLFSCMMKGGECHRQGYGEGMMAAPQGTTEAVPAAKDHEHMKKMMLEKKHS